ncbi:MULTISPECIES: flagellar biosynthesis regulator FlaF [unclassified Pseudophaeobacter]|uniref:flagellar biosynthesis regulator FlaF n=1 Tax=unclassified Pseudophaeobacter TaxID=2637024 RepID=UPI000EFBC3D3|nr:flagellar biosynthesis regulator FlaF [Pseudophaeobacter sp. EL27]
MNALSKARSAYSAVKSPIRTTKDMEYETIAHVTRKMIVAARRGKGGFSELAQALNDNNKLWRIFATDLASVDNPLPQDLKTDLSDLATFTRQHTSKVLQRKAHVGPLVEINTAIMRGLRSGAT